MGLDISPDHFYTSAMATAAFLSSQKPGCTSYVIGEAALTKALYDQHIYMNDVNPDYVVVGETRSYNFEKIEKAIELVKTGQRLSVPILISQGRQRAASCQQQDP